MNRFIVTNVEHIVEAEQYNVSVMDPYRGPGNYGQSVQHHQSFELTLRPMDVNENTMFKLQNLAQAGRTVTLNDTEYNDFLEPYRNEFIDFMMDKHPEKIIADPKAWDRLLGRS